MNRLLEMRSDTYGVLPLILFVVDVVTRWSLEFLAHRVEDRTVAEVADAAVDLE